jgi:outer membrane murein-binding lipoprotein Lpp
MKCVPQCRLARSAALAASLLLLAGCASDGSKPGTSQGQDMTKLDQCRADVAQLQGQLAAEIAERQKLARAARAREDNLRRQLEAMKSIERGILEREDRMRSEMR